MIEAVSLSPRVVPAVVRVQPMNGGPSVRVLHIIATPREVKSNTLVLTEAFLNGLRTACPGTIVDVIDLYNQDLPAIAGTNIESSTP
jgi:hypothetical protein